MTRAWLWLLFSLLLTLSGCATPEPVGGCVLACAKMEAALRYVGSNVPARVVRLHFADAPPRQDHAILVFRLDEGWCVYADGLGSGPLDVPNTPAFPDPLVAARLAYPSYYVDRADWWLAQR